MAIADLHRRGRGARAIAREVGRDPATISRELRRNLDPASGQYRPFAAQRLGGRTVGPGLGAASWRAMPSCAGFVQEQLRRRWSPEQICHALRERFPDQPSRHLVPETIYQAVYRPGLGAAPGAAAAGAAHRALAGAARAGTRTRAAAGW